MPDDRGARFDPPFDGGRHVRHLPVEVFRYGVAVVGPAIGEGLVMNVPQAGPDPPGHGRVELTEPAWLPFDPAVRRTPSGHPTNDVPDPVAGRHDRLAGLLVHFGQDRGRSDEAAPGPRKAATG